MEFFLFFLRKFSQLHALLEPPRLLISEKPATNPRLFDFGQFSYLYVIKSPCLLETSEYIVTHEYLHNVCV